MNLNTFIRNGELVIISRIKFKSKFFGSLQFKILMILIGIGILPCIVLEKGILNSYRTRAVSLKTIEAQAQSNILSKQLSDNDYMENQSSVTANAEIEQLSSMYDGRVMIIDRNFKIIKDTFKLEEAKYMIADEVIKCFKGENTTYYDSKNHYVEITTPVKNSSQEITGVILLNVSTGSIVESLEILSRKATVMEIAIAVVVVVLSIYFSSALVKPFARVTKSIEALTDGYTDDKISISDYTETELISEAFNKLLGRMKVIDESREEFVSNVSHELKTPLTSMKVLADSLLMQEDVPLELYKEFMTDITEEIDRENKIINDLLSLVKMDRKAADLNIKQININELLELILKRLRPIAVKRDIELVFESFRPVTAEVDEVKLTLAISNLVENAIKYNIENGWVHVSLNADHKYFYVKVADSGIGIPEEALEHVFERFYRVDKSHSREIGGTGLGLSIARNAILMHRGAIKAYSKESEGTTFTIRVPLNYIT